MKYCLLLLLISFTGCDLKNNKVGNETPKENWNKLTIRSEGGPTIILNNNDDSTTVKLFPIFDFFSSPPAKNTEVKILKVYFTLAEKDTIYQLAKDLILKPAKRTRECTEFIGHLELFIDYGQFTLSGSYTSVCDWTTLSDKTQKLNKLLKKKIKGVYFGEGE